MTGAVAVIVLCGALFWARSVLAPSSSAMPPVHSRGMRDAAAHTGGDATGPNDPNVTAATGKRFTPPAAARAGGRAASEAPAEQLRVEVLAVHPHDPTGFTQGLLWYQGLLYESDGLYGSSSLRQVDPATGEVKQRLTVPQGFFAEGLALAGNRLVQLTWKEGIALVYSRDPLRRVGELRYEGEGWGLCHDGNHQFVMSDGSSRLSFRDQEDFHSERSVSVRLNGQPVRQLNELECVGNQVYANVWQTDTILRIDPRTGRVTGVIDASGLLTPEEQAKADVLNGIAYNPETRRFYLTGKLWPKLFEVTFVPRGKG